MKFQLSSPLNRVLLATCVCLFPASQSLADWPDFRGPARDGVVRNLQLPKSWSAEENIRWRTEIPGEGWSSPIVIGEMIYLTAAIPNDSGYALALFSIQANSGEIQNRVQLFQESSDAPDIHKKNSHASPTPIFDGTHLFVHFGHQGTACVTLDGSVVWKNDSLAYPPVHGNGGTPAVVEDLVIFSRDGADISQITALDKRTGKVVWERERDVEADKKFSFCTPLMLELDGRQQLILPGSNVVQSLDPKTGQEHWRLRYEGYSVIPRPIYHAGLVFVCTGYNRPSILAIDPTGSGDVTDTHLKWQSNSNIPHTPSIIALDGKIAVVSDKGIACCFDATTGEELWKERIGGNFSASPLLVGTEMYLLSEEGVCTILDIAGQPTEIAVNKIGERCLASMAVVDQDLLLRSDTALYRITNK